MKSGVAIVAMVGVLAVGIYIYQYQNGVENVPPPGDGGKSSGTTAGGAVNALITLVTGKQYVSSSRACHIVRTE